MRHKLDTQSHLADKASFVLIPTRHPSFLFQFHFLRTRRSEVQVLQKYHFFYVRNGAEFTFDRV
jgi:hypothetical protein